MELDIWQRACSVRFSELDIWQRACSVRFSENYLLTLRHNSVMRVSNVKSVSNITLKNFWWEFAARQISSTETISGFLALSKIGDFPRLAFKWLF